MTHGGLYLIKSKLGELTHAYLDCPFGPLTHWIAEPTNLITGDSANSHYEVLFSFEGSLILIRLHASKQAEMKKSEDTSTTFEEHRLFQSIW